MIDNKCNELRNEYNNTLNKIKNKKYNDFDRITKDLNPREKFKLADLYGIYEETISNLSINDIPYLADKLKSLEEKHKRPLYMFDIVINAYWFDYENTEFLIGGLIDNIESIIEDPSTFVNEENLKFVELDEDNKKELILLVYYIDDNNNANIVGKIVINIDEISDALYRLANEKRISHIIEE